jgi:hypothetical protein
MEPREEEKRVCKAPEVRQEQPQLRRFRIVKLEERIAPQAAAQFVTKSLRPIGCVKSQEC